MTVVAVGSKVKLHYTGTLDNGEVFDTSRESDPFEFEVGAGQVIPGFDQAVVGMAVGDSKQVRITEEEGYGPYNDNMVFEADPGQFEEGLTPQVGQRFQVQMQDGQPLLLTVKSVSAEGTVVLDANHPMAGKTLTFDLEILEIG